LTHTVCYCKTPGRLSVRPCVWHTSVLCRNG